MIRFYCQILILILTPALALPAGGNAREQQALPRSWPMKATVIETARLRAIPSLNGKITALLAPGETVTPTAQEENWYQITRTTGESGWVARHLLVAVEELRDQGRSKAAPGRPPLLNLNLRDMEIRDALSAIAMEYKLNIVTTTQVQGKITLHLFKSPLEKALGTIARAGGFAYKKEATIHYIYKPQKGSVSPDLELEMKLFKIKFIEMDKIKEVLDALPGVRPVQVHESTKTVLVEDTPGNLDKIEKIIHFWDAVPQQVLIEAKVLEVTLTDDMAFGIDWEAILDHTNIRTQGFSKAAFSEGTHISPVSSTSGTGIFGNIISWAGTDHQISLAIDALQGKTTINTIASPKIRAIHGKEASVQVGGQQGYKVTTTNLGIATETIQFIDTGVILAITPFINDGNILLNVKPSINSAKIEEGVPVVNATTVSTWLIAKNGETIFIGGLIETTDMDTRSSVPLLGDLPILGWLFGRTVNKKDKKELVVLITPRIVDLGSAP
ncbi:MAG: SH3 domain-containing protein [Desulfobacterium sp.]|nr:SH3 domain-containing protein [Desulfobacterium sp.]